MARLVGEVEDHRQMMETMKRMLTGLGLEEKGGQTWDRVTRREEEKKEKGEGVLTPDRSDDTSAEDGDTVIEIEGEHGTEGDASRRRKEVKICSGAPILATNSYKKDPDSPLWNEIYLQQGDVLSYIMEHGDNEQWWLAEYSKGEVGYVPVAYLMMIVDETVQEEGCGKTRISGSWDVEMEGQYWFT